MAPLVFVSHAAADGVIATTFQEHVGTDFLGMCELFVSSNLDSISAGSEWRQEIKSKLEACHILVGLLSPAALRRPWVYVEFGAGWIRGIPTIPVCHSGLERGDLPQPISSFQALNLWEPDHLRHLYKLISEAVGCNFPKIDYDQRAREYAELTDDIRLQRVIIDWTHQLFDWNPTLKGIGSCQP
jgi:hypothetical protein